MIVKNHLWLVVVEQLDGGRGVEGTYRTKDEAGEAVQYLSTRPDFAGASIARVSADDLLRLMDAAESPRPRTAKSA
jgi:hypothetical protein